MINLKKIQSVQRTRLNLLDVSTWIMDYQSGYKQITFETLIFMAERIRENCELGIRMICTTRNRDLIIRPRWFHEDNTCMYFADLTSSHSVTSTPRLTSGSDLYIFTLTVCLAVKLKYFLCMDAWLLHKIY